MVRWHRASNKTLLDRSLLGPSTRSMQTHSAMQCLLFPADLLSLVPWFAMVCSAGALSVNLSCLSRRSCGRPLFFVPSYDHRYACLFAYDLDIIARWLPHSVFCAAYVPVTAGGPAKQSINGITVFMMRGGTFEFTPDAYAREDVNCMNDDTMSCGHQHAILMNDVPVQRLNLNCVCICMSVLKEQVEL